MSRLLNIAYALIVEGTGYEGRQEIDQKLADWGKPIEVQQAEQAANWGEGTDAEAGQNAMMAIMGQV